MLCENITLLAIDKGFMLKVKILPPKRSVKQHHTGDSNSNMIASPRLVFFLLFLSTFGVIAADMALILEQTLNSSLSQFKYSFTSTKTSDIACAAVLSLALGRNASGFGIWQLY